MLHILNFLPGDYLRRQRLRLANIVCLVTAAGGLLLIGGAVAGTLLRAASVAAVRTQVEQDYEEASLRIKDLERLEARKEDLLHKAELSAALLERVPRSTILARLTNHLPAHTSLTSLSMKREKMRVARSTDSGGKDTKSKKGKKAKVAQPTTETRVRFQLDGLAQTDVEVAEYISRLATDPLFEAVDLQFSEEFPYHEGITMRRFQLSFLLSRKAEDALEKVPTTGANGAAAAGAFHRTEEAS